MTRTLIVPLLVLSLLTPVAHGADAAETDVIHVAAGTAIDGVQLRRGQALVGDGTGGTIRGTVSVAGGNRIENVTITPPAGVPALTANGSLGAVSLRDVRMSLSGGEGAVLTGATGEILWTGGGISGTGIALRVTGGSGRFTMTKAAIDVVDATAVVVRGSAMNLVLAAVSARGATKRIDTGIVVDKLTGSFSIDGGTVSLMQARGISVTDSANVTLRNVTFDENAANGVSAVGCGGGEPGRGSVAGCNAAIYLSAVHAVSIEGCTVTGSAQVGLNGIGVTDLAVTNTKFDRIGNENYEHAIQLENVAGKARFSHVSVSRAASRALSIENDRGTVSIEIADCTFGESPQKTGAHGVHVAARGTAEVSLDVTKTTFRKNRGSAVNAAAFGAAKLRVHVADSTFRDNAASVTLTLKDAATLRYAIVHNTSSINRGAAISVNTARPSTGVATGTIAGNTIGVAGAAGSGAVCGTCTGVAVRATGDSHLIAVITDNIIREVDGYGISAAAADGAPAVDVTITGNRISEPAGADALNAIHLQSGAGANERAVLCASVGGAGALANTITGDWPAGAIMLENQYTASAFRLAGFSGDGTKAEAVKAFVSANNGRAGVEPLLAEKTAFTGGAACSLP